MTEKEPSGKRPYWAERQGRRAHAQLRPEQARRAFSGLVAAAEKDGRFQEAFGYECVDDGFVPGTLGTAIEERLLIELGQDGLWPVTQNAAAWHDDTFFDMIEFLYDHISSPGPGTGRYHSFGNCGWHYNVFSPEPARTEYRQLANAILRRLEPAFEMTEQGEIVRTVPDGVAPLLESATGALEVTDRAHVEAAITKYRSRSSTTTDRRDAVRDLMDVLERLRASVKATMAAKDEAMLFEMANKFWIRHNKPDERRDYDHDAWWSWLFYVALASIALVTHIEERDAAPATTPIKGL